MEWLFWLLLALVFSAVFGGQGRKPPSKQQPSRRQPEKEEQPVRLPEHLRQGGSTPQRPAELETPVFSTPEDRRMSGREAGDGLGGQAVRVETAGDIAAVPKTGKLDSLGRRRDARQQKSGLERPGGMGGIRTAKRGAVWKTARNLNDAFPRYVPENVQDWRRAFVASVIFGPPKSRSRRREWPRS